MPNRGVQPGFKVIERMARQESMRWGTVTPRTVESFIIGVLADSCFTSLTRSGKGRHGTSPTTSCTPIRKKAARPRCQADVENPDSAAPQPGRCELGAGERDDIALLDAYSRAVMTVAEAMAPTVDSGACSARSGRKADREHHAACRQHRSTRAAPAARR